MAKAKKGKPPVASPWLTDARGTRYYNVVDPATKQLLIRVGNYHDPIINEPKGMSRFLDFFPVFSKQVDEGKWGGFILDSVSSMNLSGRKWHQYELNEGAADGRQWYAGATDLVEEVVACQVPALPCHVIVTLHVNSEKIEAEGTMHRQPHVPGRRLAESKVVAASYPELWHLYARTDEGEKRRWLQTETDEKFIAGTCIGVPDDLRVWKATERVWAEITKRMNGLLHVALYGDPHVGKSRLAAWLAKAIGAPVYVALFDGLGKDAAYRAQGEVVEKKEDKNASPVEGTSV